jgi:hypothetical protein
MEDMIGQPIVAFINPVQHTFFQNKLNTVKQGDNFFIPVSLLGKDGRLIEGLLSSPEFRLKVKATGALHFLFWIFIKNLFLKQW